MKDKNLRRKIISVLLVCAAAAFLSAALFTALRVMFSTIGNTTVPPYDAMYPHKFPEKQVYIAGYDTELDLTGGELCFHSEERKHPNLPELCSGEFCEDIISMEEALLKEKYPDVSVSTNADFSVPGKYEVLFRSKQQYMDETWYIFCSFPIVVIDPKDAVK